jgi:MFS-type transporter involved in bile tolerance (Atg22 family)
MWLYTSIVFIIAQISAGTISKIIYYKIGVADSLYNSLLNFISENEDEINENSSKGYMLGYLGIKLYKLYKKKKKGGGKLIKL